MPGSIRLILTLAALVPGALSAGCATDRARKRPPAATGPSAMVHVTPVRERIPASLTLDEIQPRVTLAKPPASPPTSQPAAGGARAPVEAVRLYAQAVDALQAGRRFAAIGLLQKAIELDPQSFELNYALGRAHLIGRAQDEQAMAVLERAAALNPDHLELQTDLGRHHLTAGDAAKALEHLRLAVQTTQYKSGEPGSAIADLFLGRALQQAGYDRAALEQYAKLLRRVQGGGARSLRHEPHLAFLVTDRLYVDIGDLYARNGQFDDALAAFEPAAKRDPSDFDLEARVVRALVGAGRNDDASRRAADAVVRFRASKESLDLLREVHRTADAGARSGSGAGSGSGARIDAGIGAGGAGSAGTGAADALVRTLERRPGDTTVLFALVEMLRDDGRWAEADGFLASHAERAPEDFAIVRRRVLLAMERGDAGGAARLLVQTLAAKPDFAAEVASLWHDVASPARPGHLRLAQLQALPVMPWEAAAKHVAVAALAADLRRTALLDQSLDEAVRLTPPFAPAFRERLARVWRGRAVEEAERVKETESLVAAAASDQALAHELTGLSLAARKQDKAAAAALEQAMAAGGRSPALLLSYATALRAIRQPAKYEQLLWKLLSDRPSFEDAYSSLYAHYAEAGSEAQADRVLNTWIVSVPYSASARLLQAARHFRTGKADAAEQVIARLLEERGDDVGVLRTAYAVYSRTGKTDKLVALLEARLREQPGNLPAASALLDLYDEQGRSREPATGPAAPATGAADPATGAPPPAALAIVDAARQALADEADPLYQVAHLYTRIGQRDAAEAALRRVLEIEPAHAPASNDLGYTWAERGENLPQAEALLRQAVAAEPDNASFLDSLGWVLYKRGKFAEARAHLERAAADASQADAVVLDHLGDLLYRLGERDAAARQWEQAGAKLADPAAAAGRDDLAALKQDLARKAEQLKSGGPVTVSPVVEEQAKN